MTKYFTNNFSEINLYKKPSVKSEMVTQMIYGDSFSIQNIGYRDIKNKAREETFFILFSNTEYIPFCKPMISLP